MSILECRDLSREFDGVHAVDGVSMAFERGTLTGIIGPNGAGKSTVLAMLAGTLPATSGQILFKGEDVTGLPAYRRARLGLVRTFQLASEFKRLTVLENLLAAIPGQRGETFAGALAGRALLGGAGARGDRAGRGDARAFGLLALADRYAGDLSGGQRRLVEIMRALMAEPRGAAARRADGRRAPAPGPRDRRCSWSGSARRGRPSSWSSTSCRSWTSSATRWSSWRRAACSPQGTMAALRRTQEVVEAYLVG